MKIGFIVPEFPALSQTFILNQVAGLRERGHEVEIYADGRGLDGPLHPKVTKHDLLARTRYAPAIPRNRALRAVGGLGLCVRHGWRAPGPMLRSLNVLRFGRVASSLTFLYETIPFLDRPRFDVVHCHFGPKGVRAARLKEIGLIRDPILVSFHGYDVNVVPRALGEGCYSRLFAAADLCTASSEFLIRKVVALGAREDQVVKLPSGVDLTQFPFAGRRLEKGAKLRILTVARLVEVKGIEYSIRALAKVADRFPDVEYRVAGSGPLREPLERLARDLGVSERVHFLGPVTQEGIVQLYAGAHIFVLSGVVGDDGAEEGQGVVLLEAAASGLPIIASRVGGIPESVLDGRSGFLVPPRDVDALAERISYLAEHPEIRPDMGRAGREHVEKHYDMDTLNDRLVEIYRELAGHSSRRQ
jgi:colanic acid/amylovoran biosynthesis glycosyltransferase